jgi:hypothetical protein
MEKLVYGLWRPPDRSVPELAGTLLGPVATELLAAPGLRGLRLSVEDPAADAMRWGTSSDGELLCGAASLWLDSVDQRDPVEAALAPLGCTTHGYLVSESTALPYATIDWPLGTRSPGVSLVTFFPKREGLTDEEFFAVWHGEQTPISFELHPLTVYLRNTVVRPITPEAPPFRGIVEESVPTLDDLLDLHRFYSSGRDPAVLQHNLDRSMALHHRFTDMDRLQMTPCAEHLYSVVSS